MPRHSLMKLLSIFILPLLFLSCTPSLPPLQTVKNLDLNRYDGEWHEIARLPNRFEKDIIAAKATYGVGLHGPVRVLNEGLKSDGKTTRITGSAKLVGDGKLKVRFDPFPANLFSGDYWVLWVNESYTRAIVGSPDRKYLWLLSKDPKDLLPDFVEPLQMMKNQGFQTDQLFQNPKRLAPNSQPSLLVSR